MEFLWLWCSLAAVALIRPLAWGPPYAEGAALEKTKKAKKKNNKKNKCPKRRGYRLCPAMGDWKINVEPHFETTSCCCFTVGDRTQSNTKPDVFINV